MRRNEVSGKEWTVPAERCKTGLELVVPLSPTAQSVLDKVPKVGKSGFVFTTDGQHQISGFSKFKSAFDERMLTELRRQNPDAIVPNWRLHDLRRTARSLMGRAGVLSDHAERCLGHVMGAIRGTYDKYQYLPEKARAFEALESLIDRIVNPPADNVASLDEHRARGVS
jgi:integrase